MQEYLKFERKQLKSLVAPTLAALARVNLNARPYRLARWLVECTLARGVVFMFAPRLEFVAGPLNFGRSEVHELLHGYKSAGQPVAGLVEIGFVRVRECALDRGWLLVVQPDASRWAVPAVYSAEEHARRLAEVDAVRLSFARQLECGVIGDWFPDLDAVLAEVGLESALARAGGAVTASRGSDGVNALDRAPGGRGAASGAVTCDSYKRGNSGAIVNAHEGACGVRGAAATCGSHVDAGVDALECVRDDRGVAEDARGVCGADAARVGVGRCSNSLNKDGRDFVRKRRVVQNLGTSTVKQLNSLKQRTVQQLNGIGNDESNRLLAMLEEQFARVHGAEEARAEMVRSGGCWRLVARRWPGEFEAQIGGLKNFLNERGKVRRTAWSYVQFYMALALGCGNWAEVCEKSKESLLTH